MRYIDKYKVTTHNEAVWDVSEWQFFAGILSAFLLFILVNVLWETMKEDNKNVAWVPSKKRTPSVFVSSMREQLFLLLYKIGGYMALFSVLFWNYGKDKLRTLKHKIVYETRIF